MALSSKRVPLIPIFYFVKNQSSASLFLLSAKSHTRLSCSFASALTTLRCRYQLFAVIGACSLCSHKGEQTKSLRPPFSKWRHTVICVAASCSDFVWPLSSIHAWGFQRQSLKSLSAESEISYMKRSFEGLGELFSRRKATLNCMQNDIYPHKICRWHILWSIFLKPQKV